MEVVCTEMANKYVARAAARALEELVETLFGEEEAEGPSAGQVARRRAK